MKMDTILEILKMCITIIVGALIAIIPTIIEKNSEKIVSKQKGNFK